MEIIEVIILGTVHQRAELVPRVQLWFRSAQHWLTDIESIPKKQTQPAFDCAGGMS
jgi:hypothetical protein